RVQDGSSGSAQETSDGEKVPLPPQPPRAADHGRRLPARPGHRGRGPAGSTRPAQLFGCPGPAPRAGGKGTPQARVPGAALRLPADGASRSCQPPGFEGTSANVLCRLDGASRGRLAGRVRLPTFRRGAGAIGAVDRPGQKGRTVTMNLLLDSAAPSWGFP